MMENKKIKDLTFQDLAAIHKNSNCCENCPFDNDDEMCNVSSNASLLLEFCSERGDIKLKDYKNVRVD